MQESLREPGLPDHLKVKMEELAKAWLLRVERGCRSTAGRPIGVPRQVLGPHALLTYTGPKLVLGLPDIDLSEALEDETRFLTVLKRHPQVVEFWSTVRRRCAVVLVTLSGAKFSLCLEVCLNTLAAERVVRLHIHFSVEAAAGGKISVRQPEELALLGALPQISGKGKWSNTRLRRSCSGSAHYYCQAPKRGKLFSEATIRAFVDFSVNPEWITSFLQADKMSIYEFVKAGKAWTTT